MPRGWLTNAKTVTAGREESSVASVHRRAIAMAGIVQEFSRIAQPAPRTSAPRPFGRPFLRAQDQTDLAARLNLACAPSFQRAAE